MTVRRKRDRDAARAALRETADLVNRQEPLDEVVGGICERLMRAVGADEIHVALGDPASARVKYRRNASGMLPCDDEVDDPLVVAVLGGGEARLGPDEAPAMYAPLRDDGRTVGTIWALSDGEAFGDRELALLEAFGAYLSMALQRAALRERTRRLEEMVAIDALTGVANRRAFDLALAREWARAMRTKRPLSVALLDIDHFKMFNDSYGHREGDACLQHVAHACNASVVRSSDVFARYGGEEFSVILPETDEHAAQSAAERLRAAVESLAIPHVRTEAGIVTASVGISSMVPKRGTSPFELIERADRGLYRAKGTGRNRVVCVDASTPLLSEPFTLMAVPNNLPADVSTLIGRDADLTRIVDLLSRHRVVTLIGAGGVGKTRVALSAARQLAARFADGVWWLELAALRDGAHLVTALAALFGVEEAPPRPLLESVIAALRSKTLLLVVDNCEHLVIEVAQVVTAVLQVAPTVCVLATSRERLGISGEATYRVPPLMAPPPNAQLAAVDALEFPAIRLFVERAREANDAFELTDRNTPAVAEICRRLDGIALAIELAAARVRVLDAERIATLLDQRFRLLGTGDRGALAHHQTLRATLDWSYELLGPAERELFARLAVFAGGFTLDAVVGICTDDALDASAAFTALSALVDKSLVAFEAHERYRILETMREYASERLTESGRRSAFAQRHAEFFRDFVERVSVAEGSGPYRTWLAPLEAELDNLRAALSWTLRDGHDVPCGAAIAAAFVETSSLGRWTEWGDWNRHALAELDPKTHPALRGRLLTRRAEFASHYGAFGGTATALEAAREAVTLLREGADTKWRLEALNAYATATRRAGRREDSLATAREGLDLARETHDFVYQASFLRRIASFLVDSDPTEAAPAFEESIALCRLLENDFGLALSHHWMSHMYYAFGQLPEAVDAARTAVMVRREMGDWRGLVQALTDFSAYKLALGRVDEVAEPLREALEIVRRTENALGLAFVAQNTAGLAAACGDGEAAAGLAGFSDARYRKLGIERERVPAAQREVLTERLQEVLGAERAARAVAEGEWHDATTADALIAAVLTAAGELRFQAGSPALAGWTAPMRSSTAKQWSTSSHVL